MPGSATKLGPGTLVLGETTTTLDMSCQLSAAWIKWDKDKEDDVAVLCGESIAGGVEYTGKLTGTVLTTPELVTYTWDNKGTQVPFRFIPNSSWTDEVTGTVTVDPLDLGGDEVKKNMTADFEWDCVGEPALTPVTP